MSAAGYRTHLGPGHPAPRKPRDYTGALQIGVNLLSVGVALFALYEVFGVSEFSATKDLSNDDARIARENNAWKILFDPAGFALLLTLLISAIVIHTVSRQLSAYSNGLTRAGLITTAAAFLLSFFRVSALFPLLAGGAAMVSNEVENGSDVRAPAPEEFVLAPAQLSQYRQAAGVRIASGLTNNSADHWESATLAITFTDAGGTPCGSLEHVEGYIAPGQERAVSTDFLSPALHYSDPSCVPVAATAGLVNIDVDSRSQITMADYERAVPAFTSLMPFEQPWVGDGAVKLSITGAVTPESLSSLTSGTGVPIGLEVVDHQGLRLDWCVTPDDLAPDGTFTTPSFHSPVTPGEFQSVVVIPAEC